MAITFSASLRDERLNHEVDMFGCTVDQLRENVNVSLRSQFSAPAIMAMKMMSDAQKDLQTDQLEHAVQTLNRAKWILSEYCMGKKC